MTQARLTRGLLSTLLVAAALGCAGLGATRTGADAANGADPQALGQTGQVVEEPATLKEPPPAGIAPTPSFPPVERQTLANGLTLNYLSQGGLPLMHIVLTFSSGRASEMSHLGAAQLSAELIKFGGTHRAPGSEILNRLESFGSTLAISVEADHTTFELSVMNDDVERALSLLAELVITPRLPYQTFAELKQVQQASASRKARGDFHWGNQVVLYRQLFQVPASVHPYARFEPTEQDLEPLSFTGTKAWLEKHFVPKNARLILVGSLDTATTMQLASTAFAGWQGGDKPQDPSLNRPAGPERFTVFLIDREDSALSEISLGVLGAPQKSAAWPALAAATHLLGIGPASRLYLNLKEQQQLAIKAHAELIPLVGAPAVVKLAATCRRQSTIEVTKALLQQLKSLGETAPKASEVAHAVRAITGGFLNHENPQSSLADMLAFEAHFNLSDNYYSTYHAELRELSASSMHETVKPYFDKERSVLVVSTDASQVAPALAKLAPVVILDPDKSFSIKERLPYTPL